MKEVVVGRRAPAEDYTTQAETLSVDEKLSILQELGQPELIQLFQDYRQRPRRRRKAPLDQRISISITKEEKLLLLKEVEAVQAASEGKMSMAQFIRNRGMASVDLARWRACALEGLKELNGLLEERKQLEQEKRKFVILLEDNEDEEEGILYNRKLSTINGKLKKLTAARTERTVKVTSRMTMPEAEAIKWKAQRLCISTSDFLRMMLFDLEPCSHADEHMSVDARRRFYVSIIEVAKQGWGENPTVYQCSQCEHYLDELQKAQELIEQLRRFPN